MERWGVQGRNPPLSSYAGDTETDNFCKEEDFIPLSLLYGGEGGGERGGGGHSSSLSPTRSQSAVTDMQLPWFRDLERPKRGRTVTEASTMDGAPDSKRPRRSASLPADKWSVIWKDLPQCRNQVALRPHVCEHCYKPGHSKRKCKEIQWPCIMCAKVGHDFKACPEWNEHQKMRKNTYCFLCKNKGHTARNCPNHWRQYHNTTHLTQRRQLDLNNQLRTDRVYCFHCGRQGHFGFQCVQLQRGHMGKTLCFPLIHKYSVFDFRPLVHLPHQGQRPKVTSPVTQGQSTRPPWLTSNLYEAKNVDVVRPRLVSKDQVPQTSSSSVADASGGTTEGSQSCVSMEIASSDDEDDGVTYIVLDEVHGDINSQSVGGSRATPEVLSPPPNNRQQTSELFQKESRAVRKTEVEEEKAEVMAVTDKTLSQNPHRNLAAQDVLIPASLITIRPTLPHPSWTTDRLLSELPRMKSTMVTNEEESQRFQKWSGVVTSLCHSLDSLMENLKNYADASWHLKKAGAPGLLNRATAPGQLEAGNGPLDHALAPGHMDGLKAPTLLDGSRAPRQLDARRAPGHLDGMNPPTPLDGARAPGQLDARGDPGHLDRTNIPRHHDEVHFPTSISEAETPLHVNGTEPLEAAIKPRELEMGTSHPLLSTQPPLSLHPAVTASLLRRLRDLYQLALLWMMQEGMRQRRSSEESALRRCTNQQLAFHPSASVYPVQTELLPPPHLLTTTNPEPKAKVVSSSKTDSSVTNDISIGSPSTHPLLSVHHCTGSAPVVNATISQDGSQDQRVLLQGGNSTPLQRTLNRWSTPVKSPVFTQEGMRGTATTTFTKPATSQPLDEILATYKTAPVTIAKEAHQTEIKQADLALKENKDDSSFDVSLNMRFQAVSLQSASLDLLQAVDKSYLDQRSMNKLQKALAKKRHGEAGKEEGRQQEADRRDSSSSKACCNADSPVEQNGASSETDEFKNQFQFRLNPLQTRRIRSYVKELASYPEAQELTGEVVVAVDVLDSTIPCDTTLQTLSNLASVALKKSDAAVASLKASIQLGMRCPLEQNEGAASSPFSPQLLPRKRKPLNESAPVGTNCSDGAHEPDKLTTPAPLCEEEVKGGNPVAAKGPQNRRKRRRISRRKLKATKAEAHKDKGTAAPHFLAASLPQHSLAGSAGVSTTKGNKARTAKQQMLHPAVGKSPSLVTSGDLPAHAASTVPSQALSLPRKALPPSPSGMLSGVGHPIPKPSSATPPQSPVTLQSLCDLVELKLQPLVASGNQVAPPATDGPQTSKKTRLQPLVANSNQVAPSGTDEPQMSKRDKLKRRKVLYRAKRKLAKRQAAEKKA